MNYDEPGLVEATHRDIIAPIEDIDAARNGKMFILVDHEDRENEGDLVTSAIHPDAITMATHGRGLICLAMTSDRVDDLGPDLMRTNNSSPRNRVYSVD